MLFRSYLQKCTSTDKLRTVHFFFGANRRRLSPPTSHTTYPDFMIIRNSDRILRFSVKIYQKSRDNFLHQICSSNPFRKYRSSNRLALLQRITHSSNISSLLKIRRSLSTSMSIIASSADPSHIHALYFANSILL